MQVQRDESETKGRVFVGDAQDPTAEMTYSRAGDGLIIIDHTHVDDSLRGQGVGRILLDTIVEDARTRGLKILPLCPYAKAQFNKDPSLRDVLSGS